MQTLNYGVTLEIHFLVYICRYDTTGGAADAADAARSIHAETCILETRFAHHHRHRRRHSKPAAAYINHRYIRVVRTRHNLFVVFNAKATRTHTVSSGKPHTIWQQAQPAGRPTNNNAIWRSAMYSIDIQHTADRIWCKNGVTHC